MPRVTRRSVPWLLVASLLLPWGCKKPPSSRPGEKVLRYPVRAKIGSMDPVVGDSQYKNLMISAIFDTLVEFAYPEKPFQLRTSLLTSLPERSEDLKTYTFELRDDIYFADDPAFESTGGKGPRLTTDDVFYSIKRHCDSYWKPVGYWLIQGRIEGLDELKAEQARLKKEAAEAGGVHDFDYEAPVSGLQKIDDRRFRIVLTEPFPQFLYILTMGYLSIVPREAVEKHDTEFGQHPVGSGPYRVEEFWRGSWVTLVKNENFREERIPEDLTEAAIEVGLGDDRGRRLPFIDRIVVEIFQQDQPMWLKFRAGDLDTVQVPAEYWPIVYHPDATIKDWVPAAGIHHRNLALLDLIYWGFNMEDPLWGQGEKARLLRQAISYAVDLPARNQAFYNNQNIMYQGPIPPGLDGYEPGFRARDLDKAKRLLAEAGYPDGEGLPPLRYEISKSSNIMEQAEMFTRKMKDLGIEVEVNANSFPELSDKMNKKKAQFFGLAWGADYPDAENFLQLFYGPNESPGSNSFNYKDPEYDRIFEQAKIMEPSPERTALYRKLRAKVIEDVPMIGSMARTRYYLWNDRVQNYSPEEVYYTWWKYLDVKADE